MSFIVGLSTNKKRTQITITVFVSFAHTQHVKVVRGNV